LSARRQTLHLPTPWHLVFATMTHDEQRTRIAQLARIGWTEPQLVTLSRWSLQDVRRVLAERTEAPP
jgi:hypothetical protein